MWSLNGSEILEIRDSAVFLPMATESDSKTSDPAEGLVREETTPEHEVIALFDEMHAPLRRYVMSLGLTPQDADDGVQETFLRLHKHLGSGGARTNLRGWLFQVARNLARDKRKSAWTHQTSRSRQDHPRISSIEDPTDTPEERLLKEERLGWLTTAVERLTPPQAECLQLRMAGLRYREIAAVMGIGISAVGELMQRALNRLDEDSRGF